MNTMTDTAALAAAAQTAEAPSFRDELLAAGLLIDTGENGLYGRSQIFEDVVDRLNVAITHLGADQQPELLRFPPAMRRTDFEDSEYLKSFPNLAGTIHSFCGNDMGHQRLLRALDDAMTERDDDRSDDWMAQQKPTRVVLTPAACYPIYPVMARRSPCRPAAARGSMCCRIASVMNRRWIRAACRCSASANTCAWATPNR